MRCYLFTVAGVLAMLPGPAAAQNLQGSVTPWTVTCAAEAEPPLCLMFRQVVASAGEQAGRRILGVRIQPGGDGHVLIVALPHGLYLPAGAQINADGATPQQLPFTESDALGVYAGAPLTSELLASLQASEQLTVTSTTPNGVTMGIPVPLDGFAEAHDRMLRSEPTEQAAP